MSIRDQITAAVDQAFGPDFLGEAIEYNGQPVDGIFRMSTEPRNNRGGSSATAVLQVKVSQVPAWSVNDPVLVDGVTWKVKSEGPGSTWYKHVLQLETNRRLKP
ncbi:MAG: hypothetical protein WBB19_17245 [Desulforhopalus sp.]